MGKYELRFTKEEETVLIRSDKIKTLLLYALKEKDSYGGEEFLFNIKDLYNLNLKGLLNKYGYVSLSEYCLSNGIKSFYSAGRLKYEAASSVKMHTSNANVPILLTFNDYESWVSNYPKVWLDILLPAMFGQPSIEQCS